MDGRYGFTFLLLLCIGFTFSAKAQTEICNNGIDDDGDQFIDLNDPDCICEVLEPVSLIPNPSFEDLDCCPSERSELNCASNWIQASEATTDFIHACDWLGRDEYPPPMPFPDGQGILGLRDGRVRNGTLEPFWKEYAGACLLSPMLKDSTYRFQFDVGFISATVSPPINITFFGTSDCDNLPFGIGNDAFGCPSNSSSWMELGKVLVSGGTGDQWVNAILEVTPDVDINAIAIGPDCPAVQSSVDLYYYFDNLLLSDINSFSLQISESDHPCSEDYVLQVPDNPSLSYQWYKDGVALNAENGSSLSQIYGDGFYEVQIVAGGACRISNGFLYEKPIFEDPMQISICEDETYLFGETVINEAGYYIDTFKTDDNCDIIVELELEVLQSQYDTTAIEILEGETYSIEQYDFNEEGSFPILLESSYGCDSFLLVQITQFKIFFPNIFSPNEDGVNDYFHPFDGSNQILDYEMAIFDRWGNLIFRGQEWDGHANNGKAADGVYTYLVDVNLVNGTNKVFKGSITSIR